MRGNHLTSAADVSVMLKNLPVTLIIASKGHSHAVSQSWAHNPKLIAATTQFTRIYLVFPQLNVVPSAVSERLALLQKDFSALNTELEVIIVLSSTQMDYQWSLLQGLFT